MVQSAVSWVYKDSELGAVGSAFKIGPTQDYLETVRPLILGYVVSILGDFGVQWPPVFGSWVLVGFVLLTPVWYIVLNE